MAVAALRQTEDVPSEGHLAEILNNPMVQQAGSYLIRRHQQGYGTDMSVHDTPAEALVQISEKLEGLGLQHAMNSELIEALKQFIIARGGSFARAVNATPMYIELMVAEGLPDSPFPDAVSDVAAIGAKSIQVSGASTINRQITISGDTMTSNEDAIGKMFSGLKGLHLFVRCITTPQDSLTGLMSTVQNTMAGVGQAVGGGMKAQDFQEVMSVIQAEGPVAQSVTQLAANIVALQDSASGHKPLPPAEVAKVVNSISQSIQDGQAQGTIPPAVTQAAAKSLEAVVTNASPVQAAALDQGSVPVVAQNDNVGGARIPEAVVAQIVQISEAAARPVAQAPASQPAQPAATKVEAPQSVPKVEAAVAPAVKEAVPVQARAEVSQPAQPTTIRSEISQPATPQVAARAETVKPVETVVRAEPSRPTPATPSSQTSMQATVQGAPRAPQQQAPASQPATPPRSNQPAQQQLSPVVKPQAQAPAQAKPVVANPVAVQPPAAKAPVVKNDAPKAPQTLAQPASPQGSSINNRGGSGPVSPTPLTGTPRQEPVTTNKAASSQPAIPPRSNQPAPQQSAPPPSQPSHSPAAAPPREAPREAVRESPSARTSYQPADNGSARYEASGGGRDGGASSYAPPQQIVSSYTSGFGGAGSGASAGYTAPVTSEISVKAPSVPSLKSPMTGGGDGGFGFQANAAGKSPADSKSPFQRACSGNCGSCGACRPAAASRAPKHNIT